MNRPSVQYRANPRFLGDDVRLRFGGSGDAALVYDSANDDLTLQTTDAAGDLTDRLAIRAGTDTPAVVFNEGGLDADFRVEGGTDPNLLFIDAGNDAVVFGGTSPDGSEKVKVVGDLRVDGDLDFVGAQEIATTVGDLTLNPDGDVVIAAGDGLKVQDTADSSSKDTGSAVLEGGLGIEKALFVGAGLTVQDDGVNTKLRLYAQQQANFTADNGVNPVTADAMPPYSEMWLVTGSKTWAAGSFMDVLVVDRYSNPTVIASRDGAGSAAARSWTLGTGGDSNKLMCQINDSSATYSMVITRFAPGMDASP